MTIYKFQTIKLKLNYSCAGDITSHDKTDYSTEICRQLLSEAGVAVVPSGDFGLKNAARISLVSPIEEFKTALIKISELITQKKIC